MTAFVEGLLDLVPGEPWPDGDVWLVETEDSTWTVDLTVPGGTASRRHHANPSDRAYLHEPVPLVGAWLKVGHRGVVYLSSKHYVTGEVVGISRRMDE